MKNRKLFSASDTTNETTACSYYCDPSCAFDYNCVPLPDINFYSPPPPPHLPHQNHHSISPYVIILISIIISFFLCIVYYVIVHRNGGVCNSGSSNSNQQAQSEDEDHEEFLDENRTDHPIWLIHTVGLQQSFINSITVCRYRKADGLIEGTECSVCLNEFQEDEIVRLLPKCNHAFHISCIDTWLRSHINCPMCRAHIAHETVTAAPLATTVNQNSDSLSSLAVDNQIEPSGIDRELGQNWERNREDCENRTGTEEIDKDNVNSGDDIQKFLQVQSMRRSVSLDSSLADTTNLVESGEFSCDQTKDADKSHSHSHSAIVMKQDGAYFNGDSSTEQCLHKYMKRSFSCNGRFFVNRNLNAILPL